ncbi:MAG: adenosylmethionine--8-amino-7-oxononanoate transaminase [Chitinophagales bacterium]
MMEWTHLDENIWHPFTQHALEKNRIAISHGKDTILYDVNGKAYIDAVSSWWVNIYGHANPTISNAIKLQVDKLEQVIFAGFTHEPACLLSDNLLKILPPNFSKVFFSDNGSTSVEVALKMAIQFWHNQGYEKSKIIAFKNAYHGDTFGAMAVGKSDFFSAFDDLLFDVIQIDIPLSNNFESLKNEFQSLVETQDVACFIFEPLVQGSGGMQMYDAIFLDELIKIARTNDVICIADEVMTGFGRTGERFAIDYLENKPNIICLSKGITGGFMPLSVTVCEKEIYDAFYSSDKLKTLFHGHSYTANLLGCAAANASVKLLEEYYPKIKQLSVWQKEKVQELVVLPNVKNTRTLGTIAAFEIESTSTSYFSNVKDVVYQRFLDNGILLRPLGNTIYIMPPYCITINELNEIYKVILDVVTSL